MSVTATTGLPTGSVTFMFTDIEDSTRLLASLGSAYDPLLATHARIIRAALGGHAGVEVNTEGDAFFAVFTSPIEAAEAAITIQTALAAEPWPVDSAIRVRIGLHSGEGRLGGDDYSGLDVNRAARIAASGHGGQLVVSDATRTGLASAGAYAFRDLGAHELKGLPEPERLWQVEIEGLPGDFPPLRAVRRRVGNLPADGEAIIGRDADVARVRELLAAHDLVTLTGPGGTGKTRLALAVSLLEQPSFADGAWMADLADATDRPGAVARIATTLAVRERPGRDLEASLLDHVADRRMLLVLDNLEQAPAAAPLVADLVARGPGLAVLATSRSALRIRGEQEYGVPPLPDDAATDLFLARATEVRPGLELDDDERHAVMAICQRLDGLPLAIELAAARVRMLTPSAILDRLERRLPTLAEGGRDRPARQQTLAATIEWSHQLLEPPAQALFAHLSVFHGGWDLEMAERVCHVSELGLDIFDGLSSLVDQSLVVSELDACEPRFMMLQVIRGYAADRLALEPDADQVERRHAEVVADLAEAASAELEGPDLRVWQDRLRREEDNIRAALRWAIDADAAELAMRNAGSLWRFWQYWARFDEGTRWLEEVLALDESGVAPAFRARPRSALAALVYWRGDTARSDALYSEAIALYRDAGDTRAVAVTLSDSTWSALGAVDISEAEARAAEALELFESIGDDMGAANVRAWRATMALQMTGDAALDGAVAAATAAVQANRAGGNIHFAGETLALLARIERLSGRMADARRHLREALSIFYELGNVGRLPGAFKVFAAIELATGHPDRAVRLASAAARYADDLGGVSDRILRAGDPIEEARGSLTDAEHARAMDLGRQMSIEEVVTFALAGS